MKKFNEVKNFTSIRCDAKVGTEALKELHYQANEIIFRYNMQFAFPRNVKQATEQLTEVFVKIKDLEVNDAAASFTSKSLIFTNTSVSCSVACFTLRGNANCILYLKIISFAW